MFPSLPCSTAHDPFSIPPAHLFPSAMTEAQQGLEETVIVLSLETPIIASDDRSTRETTLRSGILSQQLGLQIVAGCLDRPSGSGCSMHVV